MVAGRVQYGQNTQLTKVNGQVPHSNGPGMTDTDRNTFFRSLLIRAGELIKVAARLLWPALRKSRTIPLLTRIPITYKYSFSIGFVILILMSALGLGILNRQTRLLRAQTYDFGQTVADQMAGSATDPILADEGWRLGPLVTTLRSNASVLGAAVLSADGDTLASSGAIPHYTAEPIEMSNREAGEQDQPYIEWYDPAGGEGNRDVVTFVSPSLYGDIAVGWIMVTFSRAYLNESLQSSVRVIVAATIVMILFGIGLSIFIGRRLSRPIHQLMDASRALSKGDIQYRFTEKRRDEFGQLMSSINTMADGILQKTEVEKIFSRYVSPTVAQEILSNLAEVRIGGKHVQASVLFADIVGFTRLSEQLEPNEVADLLNSYFTHIAHIAALHHGIVDKYIGDCAMLLFGAPEEDPDHCFHAIDCAITIQKLAKKLNEQRSEEGRVTVQFRIGINTGWMLAGNMGSSERMQYTVVGDSVNLASRLHSAAGPGQIVITEETKKHPDLAERIMVKKHDLIHLRGKSEPVNSYIVKSIRPAYRTIGDKEIVSILKQVVASNS